MARQARRFDMLTIREAAALLSVSPATLRLWDRQGKLLARRAGAHGLRQYARADVLRQAQSGAARVRDAQGVVVEVAQAISGSLELHAVARTIVDAAARVVGCDRCAIYLVNGERTAIEPLWGVDQQHPEAAEESFFPNVIPIEMLPLLGHLLAHPEPLVVLDTLRDPLSNPDLLRVFGTRSLIGVGLRDAEGQVFAIMAFGWQATPYLIVDDDVFLARSLAALAEVALGNARLFSQIEQERARATIIGDVVRTVSSGRDLGETLRLAVGSLREQLGGDDSSIWLIDVAETEIIGAAESRVVGPSRIGATLSLADAPMIARAATLREPLLVALAESVGAEREWFQSLQIQASLYVPLVSQGRLVGMAFVNYEATVPDLWAADLQFAASLANQCALAIERVKLLEEASARAAELEAVINQMGEGVIIADRDGRISMVNAYAERMYGSAELDVSLDGANSAFQLLRLDGTAFARIDLPLWRAAADGVPVLNAEYCIRRRDGSEVFASGSATPIRDAEGQLHGAVLLVRDVTSRRQLEAEKDQFLTVVSHELKTPLTTIKGHTELARRRLSRGIEPTAILTGLDVVAKQIRRMEGLLADLLDIQRLETGMLPLNREPLELAELAAEARDRAQSMTERHRVELEVQPGIPICVDADRSRIDQICDNILGNAIKYSPDGGVIVLQVSSEARQAVLRIRDQGIGIPEQGRERLFERFYRGSNVRASEYGGLGIGLALSRELALRHDGRLELETTGPLGTTFKLLLPLLPA